MKALCTAAIVFTFAGIAVGQPKDAQAGIPCKGYIYSFKQMSRFHTTVMFRMHLRLDTCYRNNRITTAGASCYINDVYEETVRHSDCSVQSYRFGWNGNEQGGFYGSGTAFFQNCAPVNIGGIECIGGAHLTLMGRAYANGTFNGEKAQ